MKNQICTLCTVLLFSGISLCQNQPNLKFDNCNTYEDSCLQIGKIFIYNLSEKKFEKLAFLFSDSISFRALLPLAMVTDVNPEDAAENFKNWFYIEAPEEYEVLDSKVEVLVDCLHIYYKIYTTRHGVAYKAEQHMFCEVASGKVQKLSLLCSGPRKVIL